MAGFLEALLEVYEHCSGFLFAQLVGLPDLFVVDLMVACAPQLVGPGSVAQAEIE